MTKGILPTRWKTCASCAMPKDTGSPKLMHPRIIHLYEANFNLFTKILWGRKLVWHAEKCEALGNESRPNKSCLDIITRKMLTFNICRMTRQDLVTFDNDATSCFDHQIPLFFLMVDQKFGMLNAICDIFTEALHDMKYYIQNGMKLSEEFYCHIQEFPIFGSGKGNGASAPIWLFTSVFLIKVLQKLHQGMIFRSPDGKITNE